MPDAIDYQKKVVEIVEPIKTIHMVSDHQQACAW